MFIPAMAPFIDTGITDRVIQFLNVLVVSYKQGLFGSECLKTGTRSLCFSRPLPFSIFIVGTNSYN